LARAGFGGAIFDAFFATFFMNGAVCAAVGGFSQ
jgi:hypothetical protein